MSIVALLYLIAWLHARSEPPVGAQRESIAALLVTASVVTVLMLTAESTKYWDQQGALVSDATFAALDGDLSGWEAYQAELKGIAGTPTLHRLVVAVSEPSTALASAHDA